MENAGRAVADTIEFVYSLREISKNKKVYIFCGAGNNGGDGLVAARHLHDKQYAPEIILIKSPELFRDVSYINYNMALKTGIKIQQFQKLLSLAEGGLIVDAMLGTGTNSDVREPYLSAIRLINSTNLPVVSVDVPSGLCADTGRIMGDAVRADYTVAIAAAKTGLAEELAKPYVGDIKIADIGIPKDLI